MERNRRDRTLAKGTHGMPVTCSASAISGSASQVGKVRLVRLGVVWVGFGVADCVGLQIVWG